VADTLCPTAILCVSYLLYLLAAAHFLAILAAHCMSSRLMNESLSPQLPIC
jgi:hypothetical protein